MFDRSAWSVPADCPEPYLYDRLFSGSEIAVGVEAASAKRSRHDTLSSESDAYFIDIIVARIVYQVKVRGQLDVDLAFLQKIY